MLFAHANTHDMKSVCICVCVCVRVHVTAVTIRAEYAENREWRFRYFFFIFNSRPGRRAPRRSFHFISRFMAPQAENIEQWVTGDLQTNHNRRGIEAIYREISERNNLPARLINAVHLHFLDASSRKFDRCRIRRIFMHSHVLSLYS